MRCDMSMPPCHNIHYALCRKLYADEKAKLVARRKSADQKSSVSALAGKPKAGVSAIMLVVCLKLALQTSCLSWRQEQLSVPHSKQQTCITPL